MENTIVLQNMAALINVTLVKRRHGSRSCKIGHVSTVVLTASALLFAFALAAAPGLHEHFHACADHPQHHCAITLIQSGIEINSSGDIVAAPQGAPVFASIPILRSVWVPALFLVGCVFEHAPPTLS